MHKKIFIIVLTLFILSSVGCGNKIAGDKYYLDSSNTVSVSADEYHKNGGKDDKTYKSGEWTQNNKETYASLIKFDISALKDVGQGKLYLKLSAYHNKNIYSKGGKCSISKKFYIKRINSSWDPNSTNYSSIKSLQDSGTVVAEFTITPKTSLNEYIAIPLSIKEIVGENGFTIDQADNSFCRVAFYSHTSSGNTPFLEF